MLDFPRWRATCLVSASSRMRLPPARSRPRLTCGAGSAEGQAPPEWITSEGIARAAQMSVIAQSQTRFQRGKSSIGQADQSLAGLPAGGTMSPSVDLTAFTRTPCAISSST